MFSADFKGPPYGRVLKYHSMNTTVDFLTHDTWTLGKISMDTGVRYFSSPPMNFCGQNEQVIFVYNIFFYP